MIFMRKFIIDRNLEHEHKFFLSLRTISNNNYSLNNFVPFEDFLQKFCRETFILNH